MKYIVLFYHFMHIMSIHFSKTNYKRKQTDAMLQIIVIIGCKWNE